MRCCDPNGIALLALSACLGLVQPVASGAEETSDACLNNARLSERLEKLAERHADQVELKSIARTREGRKVWAMRLAASGPHPPEERRAVLLVAGLDAMHLVGTEVAVELASKLLAAEDKILKDHTVYVLPRINPDGAERYLGVVRHADNANTRPTDDDHDGVFDDDPPEDLNGDGFITQMRVKDPAEATHAADPDDPRLLYKADRAKGERPVFKLYLEGVDNDGDGEYNEDAVGGVDPNRNFPHAYDELGPAAGIHQLSEPETLALAQFVLDRPQLCAVIVYGRHDNIAKVPGHKKRDISGRGYRDLHPGDEAIYKHLSEKYKEITNLEHATTADNAGAFYAWCYNQRGLPTFATTLWTTPKPVEKQPEVTTQPASQPSNEDAQDEKKKAKQRKPRKDDPVKGDREWLRYSDEQRNGDGFVPWHPYDHPTLGQVEIGGFVPGFRTNPPAGDVDAIAERQVQFVRELTGWLPHPIYGQCTMRSLSPKVAEVEMTIINDGYLPTALAMARTARVSRPFVVRLEVPDHEILGGKRGETIRWLDGMGGTAKVKWLVSNIDSNRTIRVHHPRFGVFEQTFNTTHVKESTNGQAKEPK